jgi:hypothetical protein
MPENTESIFSSGFDDTQPLKRRWFLLPWWIRAFAWLFLLAGVLTPFILIAGFFRIPIMLNLYGLSSTVPLSLVGLSLIALYMLKGLAAYGLWAEKDWGITVAFIDGLIGVVVCIANIWGTADVRFYFRLDIIILLIYLIKLYRLREQWKINKK